ncbi:MAG: potassium-transporting ATPase subunit B, partial [Paucibacter sp.]|nr:potassium-transporting ATPase subunit B [Roseateles sp.]
MTTQQSQTQGSTFSLLDPSLVKPALLQSFAKLDPRVQWRNPVMFVVFVGSLLTSLLWLLSWRLPELAGSEGRGFMLAISLWLWFTVLFANFA